jgi:hypothetical protein
MCAGDDRPQHRLHLREHKPIRPNKVIKRFLVGHESEALHRAQFPPAHVLFGFAGIRVLMLV